MTKNRTPVAVAFPSGEVYEFRSMWDDSIAKGECVALYGKAGREKLKAYRVAELLKIIPVKATLLVVRINEGRAAAGHYRVFIPVYADGRAPVVTDITRRVADAVGFNISQKTGGIVMGGYGYSKPFQIVYSLGMTLWPNGTPEPHGTRNGVPDSNGGYALGYTG